MSVVIPHFNTPGALATCIASIVTQSLDHGDFEIIVVDNGSTTSLDPVRTAWPAVSFLTEPTRGPGPARNLGAGAARAPILAFIDADCRAATAWLQAVVTAVEADPRTPVGGDVRIDFIDAERPTPIEAFEAVFGFRQKLYIEKKQFSVTANLAMTAALFRQVGGFAGIDTAEDLDWGRRAAAAGHRTRFCADMRVFHPARPDFPSLARKWQRLIHHEWHAYDNNLQPRWRWQLRAAALVLSVPFDTVRLFTSDQISGFGPRCSAIPVLARQRWFRMTEMLRVAGDSRSTAGPAWNLPE